MKAGRRIQLKQQAGQNRRNRYCPEDSQNYPYQYKYQSLPDNQTNYTTVLRTQSQTGTHLVRVKHHDSS